VSDISQLKNKSLDLKIMYVEDDESVREGLYSILSKIFSKLTVAVNGQEGLQKYAPLMLLKARFLSLEENRKSLK